MADELSLVDSLAHYDLQGIGVRQPGDLGQALFGHQLLHYRSLLLGYGNWVSGCEGKKSTWSKMSDRHPCFTFVFLFGRSKLRLSFR